MESPRDFRGLPVDVFFEGVYNISVNQQKFAEPKVNHNLTINTAPDYRRFPWSCWCIGGHPFPKSISVLNRAKRWAHASMDTSDIAIENQPVLTFI